MDYHILMNTADGNMAYHCHVVHAAAMEQPTDRDLEDRHYLSTLQTDNYLRRFCSFRQRCIVTFT